MRALWRPLPSERWIGSCLVLAMLPMLSGCAAVGAIVAKTTSIKVKPSYTGLKGQTIGVMVYASPGIRIDHPMLQLDIAHQVDSRLRAAATASSPPDELKGTTFPPSKNPDAMFAFQRNNPQMAESMLEFAPRLGVSRLIYIEVDDFALHPENIPELFRGKLTARIEVFEVTGGYARSAYKDSVESIFPEKCPPEGLPGVGEAPTYRGAIEMFGQDTLGKFITHLENE